MTRPSPPSPTRRLRWLGLPLLALLGGCNMVVMHPSGDVAMQQRNLILVSTGLMLLVIVPVIALTVLFAWRYRQSNTEATYAPDWDHSTHLELAIWSIPLLIIIVLGAVTWTSTHLLDPYRPIERTAPGRAIAANTVPLEVEVVALDWKWLFIYPQLGIATVNELATPVDQPIKFKLTASTVMNAFYVPAMAGMVYAMPGMETKLHAVINRPGTFEGIAANYNGAGFSDMKFPVRSLTRDDFDRWVAGVKQRGGTLDRATYLRLERPSERVPAQHYRVVAPDLFTAIVGMCVRPGTRCAMDMGMADRHADGHGAAAGAQGNPAGGNGEGRVEGGLLRAPQDKGEAPHWSQEKDAHPRQGTRPAKPVNRDFTYNLPARALMGSVPATARS